jgi:hypothetical protein
LLAPANGPLTATLLKFSATLNRFVTVTVRAELMLPAARFPKLTLVGETLTGALPLPESVTACVPALSVIVMPPEAEPTATGVNVTCIVHDAPGVTAPLQLFVWLNGPVALAPEICSGPVPLLRTVIVRALLVVPTTCDWNDSVAGVTETDGAVPVPLSASVCDVPKLKELSVTTSDPLTVPVVVGAKETLTVQFDPAASTAGQLFVCWKPPFAETASPFSGLPPKFVMMMVCAGLVVPTFCENVSVGGLKPIAEGSGVGNGTGVAPKT